MRILRQCQLYKCVIFALTQQYANCGFLEVLLYKAVVIIDIHLHLPQVFVGKFVCFQVNKNVALQQPIIEYQIYIIIVFIESKTFLSRLE